MILVLLVCSFPGSCAAATVCLCSLRLCSLVCKCLFTSVWVNCGAGVCWHACPVFVFMVFPFAECLFTPSDEGFSALRVSCCGRLRYDVCVEELNQQKVKRNDRKPLFWKEESATGKAVSLTLHDANPTVRRTYKQITDEVQQFIPVLQRTKHSHHTTSCCVLLLLETNLHHTV